MVLPSPSGCPRPRLPDRVDQEGDGTQRLGIWMQSHTIDLFPVCGAVRRCDTTSILGNSVGIRTGFNLLENRQNGQLANSRTAWHRYDRYPCYNAFFADASGTSECTIRRGTRQGKPCRFGDLCRSCRITCDPERIGLVWFGVPQRLEAGAVPRSAAAPNFPAMRILLDGDVGGGAIDILVKNSENRR